MILVTNMVVIYGHNVYVEFCAPAFFLGFCFFDFAQAYYLLSCWLLLNLDGLDFCLHNLAGGGTTCDVSIYL
jgi:hypothetical protein